MNGTESARLAQLSSAIRESSLRRLHLAPAGYENWQPAKGLMSFADIAHHLVDADNWLIRMLVEKNLDPIEGSAGEALVERREQYLELLDRLERVGRERESFIRKLGRDALEEHIFDARFGQSVSAWWIIVRGNFDHEIHHRGQLALYLRLIAGE